MTGELTINGVDAYTTYGISLTEGSIAKLMTPPPIKSLLTNKVRGAHGKTVVANQTVYKDERDLTLTINLTAKDKETFLTRYANFCNNVLATGKLNISTSHQTGVVYKCIYISCTEFQQFMFGIGSFTLRLNEPNPNDRTASV